MPCFLNANSTSHCPVKRCNQYLQPLSCENYHIEASTFVSQNLTYRFGNGLGKAKLEKFFPRANAMDLNTTLSIQERGYPRGIKVHRCSIGPYFGSPLRASLSKAVRLMSSVNELREEVDRFFSMRITKRSPFHRTITWTADEINAALENARKAQVLENSQTKRFIEARKSLTNGIWKMYLQQNRMRHAWAEYFRSTLDWCEHYD